MNISQQLIQIAENQEKVYNAGYKKGKSEGGGGETVPTYDGEVEVV